jgi:polyphosphate kinase
MKEYRELKVAPANLREALERLIRREIEAAGQGDAARIIFKINSLIDRKMVQLLYEASRAGVEIDLLVRGMCCLRPGLAGISDRIRVTSIVGRFLEHSRVYYFLNGGLEECYLSSADLMPRNLDRRVETLFPVEDAELVWRLRTQILETYLRDNVKARSMQPDGTYHRVRPQPGQEPLNAQEHFLASYDAKHRGPEPWHDPIESH